MGEQYLELVNQQQIIFFRLWINILRELLPSSLLEEFWGKENEYLWIKEALKEIELIVDSTEQDIFRPKNDEKQKKYYSGKQKKKKKKKNFQRKKKKKKKKKKK